METIDIRIYKKGEGITVYLVYYQFAYRIPRYRVELHQSLADAQHAYNTYHSKDSVIYTVICDKPLEVCAWWYTSMEAMILAYIEINDV
jgi:hypothetical protein